MESPSTSKRQKKTDIVRRRTGCQSCRSKRRKCDETLPECLACVRRGVKCGGYQRRLTFKDVSAVTAESSKKTEAARWSALRLEDARGKAGGEKGVDKPAMAVPEQRQVQGEQLNQDQSSEQHGGQDRKEDDTAPQLPREEVNWSPSLDSQQSTASSPNDPDLSKITTLGGPCSQASPTSPQALQYHPVDFLTGDLWGKVQEAMQQADQTTELDEGPAENPFPIVPLPLIEQAVEQPDIHHDIDPSASLELQDYSLLPVDDALQGAVVSWEELNLDSALYGDASDAVDDSQDTSPESSALGHPTRDCQISIPMEESLVHNFEINLAPAISMEMSFPHMYQTSSSFRAAALALSASHFEQQNQGLTTQPSQIQGRASVFDDCQYYEVAVRDLNHQLKQPKQPYNEQLIGTALLLAYRDLAVGSPQNVSAHSRGLEAMIVKVDRQSPRATALFKASRMLWYDLKLMSLPTRKSVAALSTTEFYDLLDPQLAIRDILCQANHLYGRYWMEATFSDNNGSGRPSPSFRVSQWLRNTLGRQCEYRQLQQKDYHEDPLSPEMILLHCEAISERLDTWHRGLCDHDLPKPRFGTNNDFMSGNSFDTIVTFRFPDERRSLDYIMYLLSRMLCNHLRCTLGSTTPGSVEIWGKIILGIAASINIDRRRFTVHRLEQLLLLTALVSNGTAITMAILEGLIPRFTGLAREGRDVSTWNYVRRFLEMLSKERLRGKTIRYAIDSRDENHTYREWLQCTRRVVVGFGESGGQNRFRELYTFDTDYHNS